MKLRRRPNAVRPDKLGRLEERKLASGRVVPIMIGFVLKKCPKSDEALTDFSVSPRPLGRPKLQKVLETLLLGARLRAFSKLFLDLRVGQRSQTR